jgi:periplasmic protein TonB
VELIAAPPAPEESIPQPPEPEQLEFAELEPEMIPPAPEPELRLPEPKPEPQPVVREQPRPKPAPRTSAQPAKPDRIGDGSSPIPGKDATTLRSSGGALTEAKPDYLKNPPPPYPETARRKKQEGMVLLTVELNELGKPISVQVESSSGFRVLDDAAVRAVSKWRFAPARIGSIPIASTAKVPIRFQLSNSRK